MSFGTLAACSSSDEGGYVATQGTGVGIDVEAMDKAIPPGDDFYLYANGAWLQYAEVPDDQPFASRRDAAASLLETRLLAILQELANSPQPNGSGEAQLREFYRAFMNRAGIERAGRDIVADDLARFAEIETAQDLARAIGENVRGEANPMLADGDRSDGLFSVAVMAGPDGETQIPYLFAGGLGLPQAEDYAFGPTRAAYRVYVARVLGWAGLTNAASRARAVVELEQKLAAAQSRAQGNAPGETVTWDRAALDQQAPGMDWDAFLAGAALNRADQIAVQPAGAVKEASALVGSEPIDVWRDWLVFHRLNRQAGLLPKAVSDAHFHFYERDIKGIRSRPSRESEAVLQAAKLYPDVLGRLYVERYVEASQIKDVEQIAEAVRGAMGQAIRSSDDLDEAGAATMLEKLKGIRVSVGYPDKIAPVKRRDLELDQAYAIAQEADRALYLQQASRAGTSARAGEWWLAPHEAGILTLPQQSSIQISAAFIQPPIYNASSDAAANFGGIGSIIGREMARVLDLPGVAGQQGLADLAGLQAAHDAYRRSLGGKEPAVIEGFTGDQRFFIAWAQLWGTKYPDGSSLERRRAQDALQARANLVENIGAWYRAFDVQPGSRMYQSEADRLNAF